VNLPLVQTVDTAHSPESLVESLAGLAGLVLLRTGRFDLPSARYSFVAAEPFLTFRSVGSRCEVARPGLDRLGPERHFGNPWHLLDALMARHEMLDEIIHPFPLGGAFGYWGYDLKNFSEPKLSRRTVDDLELPDCHVGFHGSLVVFDHWLGQVFVVSTGLGADGSRTEARARAELHRWQARLETPPTAVSFSSPAVSAAGQGSRIQYPDPEVFLRAVSRAQKYIRAGDIYQVNLCQRLVASSSLTGWEWFKRLSAISPAPYSAYLDCGDFQLASSSPEQFLRLTASQIQTRPIKGTRPRDTDAACDARLAGELLSSAKEQAELLMITDLLRNDLGRVCEFGSVRVPEFARLEKFAQVQHLVSTVEGRLRPGMTHFHAFATCFPGGSITGAPKFRAMEIIDELEPVARGPYTGALGYLGFNRESQLSILIRTVIRRAEQAYFSVGAGIVADSQPAAEYEETLAKARGFLAVLEP